MNQLTLPSSMTTERVRTTISVDPEALEIFKRMAEAANMSVSRCMGDWLTDTADAAQMITIKMEEAKSAPMRVLREMRSLVAGMDAMVDEVEEETRARRAQGRVRDTLRAGGASSPPSSNTGVLVPQVPSSPAASSVKQVVKKA